MSVEFVNDEFLSSILHLLPIISLIFTSVDQDPYSEYGCESKNEYEANLDLDPE